MQKLFPVVFCSHGGGPCFWMDWDPPELFHGLRRYFENLPSRLPHRPAAIVVISAHWEENDFTLQSADSPEMIYDYFGFPAHTYNLKYPASGAPELAKRISQSLVEASIRHGIDSKRGFDHGVYVPLLISYPQADIPVIQISLRKDLSPAAHFELGQALKPLRNEGVLIMGSGFSSHNLREIPDRTGASQVFDQWLKQILCHSSPESRRQSLLNWSMAPQARRAHPREEHLMPLLVCAGAAEAESCHQTYSEKLPTWNVQTSCFEFGTADT